MEKVVPGSPSAKADIHSGDLILQVRAVSVLSFADMQQGSEEAPRFGLLKILYRRGWQGNRSGVGTTTALEEDRHHMAHLVARAGARLPRGGEKSDSREKKSLGLSEQALAFRQRDEVEQTAAKAGIHSGDLIHQEGAPTGPDSYGFQEWVRRDNLVGDTIRISLVHNGRNLILPWCWAAAERGKKGRLTMRAMVRNWWTAAAIGLAPAMATAQGPGAPPPEGQGPAQIIEKFRALDANKDGKITKDEVKDERMQRIFERLDADKNGEVTLEEIRKVMAQMEALQGGRRGPEGRGERGPEGRGGFGPPQPGQLLPGPLAEMLGISPEQKEKIEKLQKETNDKLEGILTAEQKERLREMRERMRGFGRPGEPGRPPEGRGERRPGELGRPPEGSGERRPGAEPGRPASPDRD